MKRIWRGTVLGVALVALAATVLSAAASGGGRTPSGGYPRSQTLITSGTQWGNIAGMNPYTGNYAAGMVGLVNETLLRFDPIKGKYIDWLAKSAGWSGQAVHDRRPFGRQVDERQGVHREATSRSTSTSAASRPPSGTTCG